MENLTASRMGWDDFFLRGTMALGGRISRGLQAYAAEKTAGRGDQDWTRYSDLPVGIVKTEKSRGERVKALTEIMGKGFRDLDSGLPPVNTLAKDMDQESWSDFKSGFDQRPLAVYPAPDTWFSVTYIDGRPNLEAKPCETVEIVEKDPEAVLINPPEIGYLGIDKQAISDYIEQLPPTVPVMNGSDFLESSYEEVKQQLGESREWVIQHRLGANGDGTLMFQGYDVAENFLRSEDRTRRDPGELAFPDILENVAHGAGFNLPRVMDLIGETSFLYTVSPFKHHQRDLRVLMTNGEIVNAEYRYSPDGDFRTNLCLGEGSSNFTVNAVKWFLEGDYVSEAERLLKQGRVEPVSVGEETDELAILDEEAEAVVEQLGDFLYENIGPHFVSLDLLDTPEGYLLSEIGPGGGSKADIYAHEAGIDQVSSDYLLKALLDESGFDGDVEEVMQEYQMEDRKSRLYGRNIEQL